MFVFIDPHMSVMTDMWFKVRPPEPQFRKAIVWLVGGRLAGILLAQVLHAGALGQVMPDQSAGILVGAPLP